MNSLVNALIGMINALGRGSGRLWRRSKLLWLGGVLVFLCSCCFCFGIFIPTTPGSLDRATATAVARSVQATAQSIETENAQVIAELTATASADVVAQIEQLPDSTATEEPTQTSVPVGATLFASSLPTATLRPFRSPTPEPTLEAPTPDQVTAVATENVIIRQGPGTGYQKLGGLKKGEQIVAIGISEDRNWLQHSRGWSSAAFLQISGRIERLVVVIVAPPPPPPPPPAAVVPPAVVPPTITPFVVEFPPTAVFQGVRIGAICNDGTSSSATGRGACSHHGGVRSWILR